MNRMWLKITISVLLVLTIVPICACDDDSDTNDVEIVIPDETLATTAESTVIPTVDTDGESLSDKATQEDEDTIPMRIISLAPSNTETLFALGLADKIVGVTEYCNYPPEAQEKNLVGGFSTVDMELVIELDPDLILAANMHKDDLVPELERRGFNVMIIAPETIDEVLDSILQIGDVTGVSEAAIQLVTEMRARIGAVTDTITSLQESDIPGVLYITWHEPIWTLGKGTITHELIEIAGATNIMADIEGHGQTELETIIWRNPQIILASSGHGSAEDSLVTWAQTEDRLSEVDARKVGRVYQLDSDLVTRPGPRIVEGLEIIAKYIHPNLFNE